MMISKQYRGITNINKTSCHTSSSIQLLYHCFPPLTDSIIDLAECSAIYHVQQLYNKRGRRGSDKKNKSTKTDSIAENDKEGEGKDNDVIESEFVYQLSWFYYLLTYNIDILQVSRTKFAKKKEEDAKQQAIAVASSIGISSSQEEYFTSPLQSVTSEEFHTILNEAAASPSRSNRKHKKKKKHNRHRHHRDDTSSRTSKTPSHKSSRNKSRGISSLSSVPTPSPTKLSPTKLKQPSEMNSAQKAAIANFMTKAKNGTSTTNDWQHLVEVMKDNNRSMYSGALNMLLDGRGEGEGGGKDQHVSPLRTDFDETSLVKGEKEGKVVDGEDDLLLQQPILDEEKVNNNERSESDKTAKISNLKQLQDAIDTFGEEQGSTTIGNLGGGKLTSNDDTPTTSDQVQVDAVNPTSFYEHINTYTSNLSTQSSKTHLSNVHINTSNVGDAGQVFRCLVSVLEYSVNEEINRLQSILDVLEIDSWNKRDDNEEKVEVGEEDTNKYTDDGVDEKQLLQKLKSIQASLRYAFSGTLISRIVGTSISVTTQSHNPMLPPLDDNNIDNRDCTTITKVQRTKENGGIERKLPVPLVLPVVKADIPAAGSTTKQKRAKKSKIESTETVENPKKKNYFPSIEESLYSITIHPNPIRGYDWRQLMKRNEVNEDVFVKKIDSDGNEILESEEVEKEEVVEDEDDLIRKLSRESLENIVDDIVNNAEEYDDDEENSFISDVASVVENEKKNHPVLDHEERSVSSTEYIHTTIQRSTSQGSVNGGSISSSPRRQIRSSFDNDDISVLSTASRSIACQTEVDDNGDPIHGMNVRTIEVRSGLDDNNEANGVDAGDQREEEKTEEELDNPPPSTDIIEKDACYAAAVAAIVSARGKSTSVASRHRRSRSAAATKRAPSVDRGRRAYKSGRATDRPLSRNRNSNEERPSRARSTDSEQVARPSRVRGTSVGSRGSYQGRSVDEYNRIRGTSVDSRRSLRGTSVERRSSRYKNDATSVDSRRNNSSGLLRSNSVGQRMVEATTAAIPPTTTTPGSGENGMESKGGGEPNDSSPSLFAPLPGITTPRGMEIGDSTEQGITVAYMPSPTNSLDYDKNDDVVLPLDSDDSSSDDDSSVDDHVSSVDTDTTSEDGDNNEQPNLDGAKKDDDDLHSFSTKSSDIDTPENIDELSLGSFTDDSELSDVQVNLLVEGGEDMKGETGNTADVLQNETITAQPPVVEEEGPKEDLAAALKQDLSAINDDKNDPKGMEVEPPSLGSTSYSAVSDSNSDDSSSSSSSDSSTSGSSSSSSSDDTSSSDSSSSDSSDDDDDGKPDTTVAAAVLSNTDTDDDSISSSDTWQSQPTNEWVTRKETRFETLPQSLVFHLKRFEYSPTLGRVEKLPGEVDIPQVLDVKACSLVNTDDEKKKDKGGDSCYQYKLTGGIVHVDPEEDEEDVEYGQTSEGHYVTFICKSSLDDTEDDKEEKNVWTEIDDEVVRTSEIDSALKILSGCESNSDKKEKDRRYATLVVYTRG